MGGFRFSGSPRSFPLRVGKRAKAKAVTKAMDDLGLKPFVPSEPLPPISTDEVHLICWLAVEFGISVTEESKLFVNPSAPESHSTIFHGTSWTLHISKHFHAANVDPRTTGW